jgi:hypothetical protein
MLQPVVKYFHLFLQQSIDRPSTSYLTNLVTETETATLLSYSHTKQEMVQRAVQVPVDTGSCQHLHYVYMYGNEYEVGQCIQRKVRGEGGAEEGPLRQHQSEQPALVIF